MDKLIGTVINYFDQIGVAAINLTDKLKLGDKIKFVGGEVEFEQVVESMQIQHERVIEAKAGAEIGLKVKEKVRKGYKVYKL